MPGWRVISVVSRAGLRVKVAFLKFSHSVYQSQKPACPWTVAWMLDSTSQAVGLALLEFVWDRGFGFNVPRVSNTLHHYTQFGNRSATGQVIKKARIKETLS